MDLINRILVLTFMIFLWIVIASSFYAFPIAKEGCQDHCGDVEIPYPFGTKKDCYLREDFFINCNNSAKPFLGNSSYHVKDISFRGQLRVWYPIGSLCCDPESNNNPPELGPNISLSGILTYNNSLNKFTVIGCDSYAYVRGTTHEHTYTTGCTSVCDNHSDVLDGCNGSGCCQTSIPDGASEINITVRLFDDCNYVLGFSRCSYAFMVEESTFHFHRANLTNMDKYFTPSVVVDWVVKNVKCKQAKTDINYACNHTNSECIDGEILGYRCKCREGFEGNPYISCHDVDECKNNTSCRIHSKCNNTVGGFKCPCDKGYSSKTDVDECIADVPPQEKDYWRPIIYAVGSCSIVVVLSYCWHSRSMKMKENSMREEYFKKNGGFLLQEKLNALHRDVNSYSVRIFTIEELQKATNNFDDIKIIGQGGFGTVYRGELIDETVVAIKKSKGVDQRGVEQFINEVILLSQINNRHVVKLFGCCLEAEVPLLVYEFINNGTLLEHLKGLIGSHASTLSWYIRVRIASQVAGVLFYLHSCASAQIIHRDIKSSNILLDQDYMAKVADFGISKLVSIDENQFSTMVQGTPGYLDPEYMHTGVLTEKSDIYSFGVVLIELLTAKKVFSTDRREAERFLASYFMNQLNNGNLLGILDHNIPYNDQVFEQIKKVAMIAKKCISMQGDDRPFMKEVSRDLEILEMQAHEYSSNVRVTCTEDQCEVNNERQQSRASPIDGQPSTFTSCDLSPVTTTTVEPIFPVGDGR